MSHALNLNGPATLATLDPIVFVESANPQDMEAKLQALITALAGSATKGFIDLDLEGAGHGHLFLASFTSGAIADAVPIPVGAQVLVYEAADAVELKVAQEAALARASINSTILYGQALAGASQGHRWMGLFLIGPPITPPIP